MTTSRVHLIVKHPTAPRVDPPSTEQQQPTEQAQPTVPQIAPPTPKTVDPAQTPTGEVEEDNPEYVVSRSIIKKLAKEIAIARRKIKLQKRQQGKGKRKLVLADSTDDDEELAAAALDIVEDARANKVTVETQFQRFIEARAPEGRPKKAKTQSTPENVVDLVSTPPPPSPTLVV